MPFGKRKFYAVVKLLSPKAQIHVLDSVLYTGRDEGEGKLLIFPQQYIFSLERDQHFPSENYLQPEERRTTVQKH